MPASKHHIRGSTERVCTLRVLRLEVYHATLRRLLPPLRKRSRKRIPQRAERSAERVARVARVAVALCKDASLLLRRAPELVGEA